MRLTELRQSLKALKDEGFVKSIRRGATGIGRTVEDRLGVEENNLPIPDIGGKVEIKAIRSNSSSPITLFTFNRAVWKMRQAEAIDSYGLDDRHGRRSLYCTVSATTQNNQGLQIVLHANSAKVLLLHVPTDVEIAAWDLNNLIRKFATKFNRLLLIHADCREGQSGEEFHFNRAKLMKSPSVGKFQAGIESGKVLIDLRLYLRENRSVRNHGSGFRIYERDLGSLFGSEQNLLQPD